MNYMYTSTPASLPLNTDFKITFFLIFTFDKNIRIVNSKNILGFLRPPKFGSIGSLKTPHPIEGSGGMGKKRRARGCPLPI